MSSDFEARFQAALPDRYAVDTRIAEGGMGIVFRGRDLKFNRPVAIKVLTPSAAASLGPAQFLREIQRTGNLHHPHILPILDWGEAAGVPYYVMPLVRDGSLRDLLTRRGRLSLSATVDLVRDLAEALSAAHQQGVLHCDIKPENILMADGRPLLADFGLSRALAQADTGRRGAVDLAGGSAPYVSPEQASGETDLDARSDLYSLACVVYEMLAGEVPFAGPTTLATVAQRFSGPPPSLAEKLPHLPPAVSAAVGSAMALRREARPPGPAEFAAELRLGALRTRPSLWERLSLVMAQVSARARPLFERRKTPVLTTVRQDLRYALRSLGRRPGITLVLLLTLGLGIGVNAAMFSLINAVMIRPLPYPEPDRLVAFFEFDRPRQLRIAVADPNFRDVRARVSQFSGLAAYRGGGSQVAGGSAPTLADGYLVSPDFFQVLGATPALGRTFSAREVAAGGSPVAVISHALWVRAYGADPGVLGRRLALSGIETSIVGVMQEGFEFPRGAELWVPDQVRGLGPSRTAHNLRVVGRLRDGASLTSAQAELTAIAGGIAREHPGELRPDFDLQVLALHEQLIGGTGATLLLLSGVVGLVLLIACTNLALVLLSQAIARRREMAIRRAVGAAPRRLVGQLLTESCLLGLLGALVGLGLCAATLGALNAVVPDGFIHTGRVTLDWRVVAFTLGLGLASGLFFGLAPAWLTAHRTPVDLLKSDTGIVGAGGRRRRLGGLLVVPQYGLSLAALLVAGLMLKSMFRLAEVDPGFDTGHLITAAMDLPLSPPSPYADVAYANRFLTSIVERVQGFAGVRSASLDVAVPFTGPNTNLQIQAEQGNDLADFWPDLRMIGPGYFRTVGIPVQVGREFERGDSAGREPVAIVTRTLATRLWGDADPLNRRVGRPGQWVRVVGVATDVRTQLDAPPRSALYLPLAQAPWRVSSVTLVADVEGDPARYTKALRDAISQQDPDMALGRTETMNAIRRESLAAPRFRTALLSGLGALALTLALLGMYGVMSFSASQRRHEIAIRFALGAEPKHILGLLTGEGVRIVLLGQLLGMGLALLGGRLARGLLFEVGDRDLGVFLSVSPALAAVVLLTCLVPARRAAQVDPATALRG